MRRTGLVIVGTCALVVVLAVALRGSHAAGPRSTQAAVTAHVRSNLAVMMQSELSRHPSLNVRVRKALQPVGPRSITGWSCPVATGSPCGAKSRTDYLPLVAKSAVTVVQHLGSGSSAPALIVPTNIASSP